MGVVFHAGAPGLDLRLSPAEAMRLKWTFGHSLSVMQAPVRHCNVFRKNKGRWRNNLLTPVGPVIAQKA